MINVQQSLNVISGFSSRQTIMKTYEVARAALAVPGCFVECGVATGGGSGPMALALLEANDQRPLHLFDSFEGLPFCGPKDFSQIGDPSGKFLMDPNLPERERLKPTGIAMGTIPQIEWNFKSWGVWRPNIHFHKGWVQDTLPGKNLAPIAFLRLDVDLYESTMCCLDQLFDQVPSGGYIWLDEFGMPENLGGHWAWRDFMEKRGLPPALQLERTDTGAGYWRKP